MNHPCEFRGLPMAWVDELRLPRLAERPREHVFVTLDEVRRLVALPVPEGNLALRRDQAAAALLFLSGTRADALGSMPMAAVGLANRTVKQWPALGTRTKNGKSATTYLLEISALLAIAEAWDRFIRAQLPPTAMWYTPVVARRAEQHLSPDPAGANRNGAIVKRMRKRFMTASSFGGQNWAGPWPSSSPAARGSEMVHRRAWKPELEAAVRGACDPLGIRRRGDHGPPGTAASEFLWVKRRCPEAFRNGRC